LSAAVASALGLLVVASPVGFTSGGNVRPGGGWSGLWLSAESTASGGTSLRDVPTIVGAVVGAAPHPPRRRLRWRADLHRWGRRPWLACGPNRERAGPVIRVAVGEFALSRHVRPWHSHGGHHRRQRHRKRRQGPCPQSQADVAEAGHRQRRR